MAYLPHRPDQVLVQDVVEMDEAVARGHIFGEVAQVAREVAKELAQRLVRWDGESALEWNVRPEPVRLTPAVRDFRQRSVVGAAEDARIWIGPPSRLRFTSECPARSLSANRPEVR